MSEERKQILSMLSDGKITVEEAERLLEALNESPQEPGDTGGKPKPKFLCVVVNEKDEKVNVRVPLALIRAGMKFSALMPEEACSKINKKLLEKGIELDLLKLKPENIEELIAAFGDLTVDVGEEGEEKVRIFCK
jgi:hypothetical protein